MFDGTKYVTPGIQREVPVFLQNILWYLIETMEVPEKHPLQVFQFESIIEDGKRKQQIVHSQEQPDYRKHYAISTRSIVIGKVYVIDDATHCTMLLADEY
ncbi:DUF960 family protein [Paenibacillus sp. 1_12]|uniref:DUF960 family protein n=1 Tax=Paenibacillus sp. 1_12 TaxID=1566278 RepID=UPI000B88C5B2|nr:DUF960 family protein [Paenibacillus sp. 1_12]